MIYHPSDDSSSTSSSSSEESISDYDGFIEDDEDADVFLEGDDGGEDLDSFIVRDKRSTAREFGDVGDTHKKKRAKMAKKKMAAVTTKMVKGKEYSIGRAGALISAPCKTYTVGQIRGVATSLMKEKVRSLGGSGGDASDRILAMRGQEVVDDVITMFRKRAGTLSNNKAMMVLPQKYEREHRAK